MDEEEILKRKITEIAKNNYELNTLILSMMLDEPIKRINEIVEEMDELVVT